jgi:Transposase DDE domain
VAASRAACRSPWSTTRRQDGTFSREQVHYDAGTDTYVCPTGKTLTTSGTLANDGAMLLYRGSTRDCACCPVKARCCPNTPARKVPRSIYERARDVVRSLAGTEAFEQSRRERKRIEMRFAHLKRILRFGRLRLRGPRRAQDEFVLAAIAQNLRRLMDKCDGGEGGEPVLSPLGWKSYASRRVTSEDASLWQRSVLDDGMPT